MFCAYHDLIDGMYLNFYNFFYEIIKYYNLLKDVKPDVIRLTGIR